MPEKTVELEIGLPLPQVQDEKDKCLVRLEASLQNYKDITCTHGQSYLVNRKQVRLWI